MMSFLRRNAITIALTVVVLVAGTILYLQTYALNQLQMEVKNQQVIIGQIKGVTDQINSASKQRAAELDQVNRHMDCIVTFFTLPAGSRARATVTDIDTCAIHTSGTPVITPASDPTSTAKTVTSTPTWSPTPSATPQTYTSSNKSIQQPAKPIQPSLIQRVLNTWEGLVHG